jgi:hypothetical protein
MIQGRKKEEEEEKERKTPYHSDQLEWLQISSL